MDELTAAAAVFAMDVSSESEEDMEAELNAGEHGGADGRSKASGPSSADKENLNGDAALGDNEDATHQVSMPHRASFSPPFAQRLTLCDSTTYSAPMPCFAGVSRCAVAES